LSKENVLQKLRVAVQNYDEDAVRIGAREALEKGLDPAESIQSGLMRGLLDVGERWNCGEAFITEVMLAASAFKAGLEILEPKVTEKGRSLKTLGRVVIGTVQGDIHDIGKSIVAVMLKAFGFEVQDLGVDVPSDRFIEVVKKSNPDIVGMSALLTTSMPEQKKVIERLGQAGLRDNVKVMVGGAPVTKSWASEIGADAYGEDAFEAVNKAKTLIAKR